MRLLKSNLKAQKGLITLVITAVFGSVALGFVLSQTTGLTKQTANYEYDRDIKQIQELKSILEGTYIRSSSEVDNPTSNIPWNNFEIWRSQSGVANARRLRGQVSNPIIKGEIQFRRIGIWFPGTDNEPIFNNIDGTFSGCAGVLDRSTSCGVFSIIDGETIQKRKYEETRQKLVSISKQVESYAAARIRFNPLRPTGTSPFRPQSNRSGVLGCENRAPEEIPCLDVPTLPSEIPTNEALSVGQLLQDILGLGPSDLIDSWGNPIRITNRFDNPANPRPPYTMEFISTTPWGAEIKIVAFYRV